MSIELASVCITHWIKKFYVFVYQFISSIFKMFIVKQTDNNGIYIFFSDLCFLFFLDLSFFCLYWSFLVRWKGSNHLLWRRLTTWHGISWVFNQKKIHSICLSFSRTSFLSIFYQKMIACNFVILQFILLFPRNNIMSSLSMEAGRHRRFQWTKTPYHAMIKVDRTMWSTIVFNKQLRFQLHFLKQWWVPQFATMSIELASVCIIQKVLCIVYRSRASSNCLLLNEQTTMGGLDGTSSSWINQNEPNWPQTPSRYIVFIKYFELLFLKEKKWKEKRIG